MGQDVKSWGGVRGRMSDSRCEKPVHILLLSFRSLDNSTSPTLLQSSQRAFVGVVDTISNLIAECFY